MTTQTESRSQLAISYIRFSTLAQAAGDSIRRQTEATERYCKEHGLKLTDQYRLKDYGKSGFDGTNLDTGALGVLKKAVESGKIPKGTVLIVENLDRLSRQEILKALGLFMSLLTAGLDIVTLLDGKRYSEESVNANPTELIISISFLTRAHDESKVKAYRASESWKTKYAQMAKGETVAIRAPSWLKYDGNQYVVKSETIPVIKRIFAMCIEGVGSGKIASILNREKVPCISKISAKERTWNQMFIWLLLQNKATMGINDLVSPPIPHFFPAVIDEVTFYKANAKIQEHSHFKGTKRKDDNILSGVVFCAKCGKHVQKIVSGSRPGYKSHSFLLCSGARIGLCDYRSISFTRFEEAIKEVLLHGPDLARQMHQEGNSESPLPALQGKLADNMKQIATLAKLLVKPELVSETALGALNVSGE